MFRKLSLTLNNKKNRGKGEARADGKSNGTSGGINVTNGVNGIAGLKKVSSGLETHHKAPTKDSDHAASRAEIESSFTQFADLLHIAQRPLPNQSGDGSHIEEKQQHSSLWGDLRSLGFKDAKTLTEVMMNTTTGALVDDKSMLMERVIQLVSALPALSKTRSDLTKAFVNRLWNALGHPPQSFLGKGFQYRSADGSGNNFMNPNLGAANSTYARSVPPLMIQPGALPDPGVIFDCLFARNEYTPHPNNVSSVLFYWASIVVHDLFRTDHSDFNKSQTSSYLDLSPLYGNTQDDQNNIRTFEDGKLKPDCFAEHRLLSFPPGCGVILIMLNRFHNYVVEQLATINEANRFDTPRDGLDPDRAKKAWAEYDNDLFQTGRLIVCGLYINITLGDYLRTIINLNRSNSTWTLDPRVDTGRGPGSIEWGVGNQVSAEFNLVYRWHSAISKKDEKWTEDLYMEMFGKPSADISMRDLLIGLNKFEASMDKDPQKRPFAHLHRGEDGTFSDDELVHIMTESIEDPSGAFGANNVPKVLRAVEILGMQQARHWRLGSLNELRKFFGLEPHKTFESINSDPKVAKNLRHLYEHPDFVEIYPGIVAEEAKKPMIPVGICPTYTISRAILSDAVVLVRGDRFYTVDYNAKNLTNWGYNEVQYDLNIEQGCVISRLFLRAFPNHFKADSVYVHYPMTIPSENKIILTDLGRVEQYSFDRPQRIAPRVNLVSYKAAKYVLENQALFHITCGDGFQRIWGKHGRDFMLSGDTAFNAKQREIMARAIFRDKWHAEVKQFYEYITLRLLHEKSFKLAGVNEVDITRDVGNLAHCHFAANVFSLPLKSEDHPHGIYTEHEIYQLMALMSSSVFFDLDPAKSFPLRLASKSLIGQMSKIVESQVRLVSLTGWISGIVDGRMENKSYLTNYGVHMIRQLLATGMSVEEVTYSQILPTAGAMVANQAQVFTQALDFYLSDAGRQYLPDINRLAKLNTPEADDEILHYAMEGIRMNGTFGIYRQATKSTIIDDDGRSIPVNAGDNVFVSFVSTARDPIVYPDPQIVSLNRPMDSYIHYGAGPHRCLGEDVSKVVITAMLKTVGRLDNLRRAPGPRGELKRIQRPGGCYVYMREDHGEYVPFPTTMRINYDGQLPALPKKG